MDRSVAKHYDDVRLIDQRPRLRLRPADRFFEKKAVVMVQPAMSVACAIPARLASRPLPPKVLSDVGGEPLVCRVWRSLAQISWLSELFVVTDSHEIRDAIEELGGRALMTSPECASGTERIWSVIDRISSDIVINVQADQALVSEDVLARLVAVIADGIADVATPIYRIADAHKLFDPNVVKVACGEDDRAMYFSRAAIPHLRDVPHQRWCLEHDYWGHMGIYAFRREKLRQYGTLPVTDLETAERLEQLRWLAGGWSIATVRTEADVVGIETRDDLEAARQLFANREPTNQLASGFESKGLEGQI